MEVVVNDLQQAGSDQEPVEIACVVGPRRSLGQLSEVQQQVEITAAVGRNPPWLVHRSIEARTQ
jgi:hypothetical protein